MTTPLTVIINTKTEEVVGAVHGHFAQGPESGKGAGLIAGPGQRLEEIHAPAHFAEVKDPDEFHRHLQAHLKS